MAKTPASFDLSLRPPQTTTKPFVWLYDELRSAILEGRLVRGIRLPSTRDLANRYGVARGTVVTVFEQLRAEGYLVGKVGAGTYVSAPLAEDLLHAKPARATTALTQSKHPVLSQFGQQLPPLPRIDIPRIRLSNRDSRCRFFSP